MHKDDSSYWDFLSDREGNSALAIINALSSQLWAQGLVARINRNGGVTQRNKSYLFELRFANSLHLNGIKPHYEICGENGSTIDFGFNCKNQNWAVELMRLEETEAVQDATKLIRDECGIESVIMHLSTDAEDRRQSTEGETIKAVERICQKCEWKGKPHKFKIPHNTFHAILVDFRTFLNGGDSDDCIHVGLGGEYVKNEHSRLYWNREPISGVFNPRTKVRGASFIRERVHFIGFVDEKNYLPGSFGKATQFIANPELFRSSEAALAAIETWPLKPAKLL